MNMNNECWKCREDYAVCIDPIISGDVIPTLCHVCAISRLDRAILYKRYIRNFDAKKR